MNSNQKSNWKDKLEELEKEINNSIPINTETSGSFVKVIQNWFSKLPTIGKAIVGLFVIMIAFSLLKTVFSLVQLIFTFGILAVIIYFVYQFVTKSDKS
ncbi:hypothetical protein [Geminocystis sp.]|uniref:hypothetical protein n=1 Tax=Geminocystis sp. TaxID=2664100 RepID=UPI003593CB99